MKQTVPLKIKTILIFIIFGLFLIFINTQKIPFFITAVIIVVLSIIFGFIIYFIISKSINVLEESARKVASGNFNIQIETDTKDEFYTIKQSFNRMISGFGTLLRISQLLNKERNLDKLLNLIISETTTIMNADRTTLFLYNKETNELWSYIAQELEIREIRLPVGKGIAGYVAKTGETVNIEDAYSDNRFDREIDRTTGFKTKSILCVPMFNLHKELLGVIQVLNKKEGIFTDYDESLLKFIATQSAIAIENAKLYADLESLLSSLIKTLVATIDARDPVTSGHSERVARYALAIGKKMGLSENELKILEYSALLHDVGKIGIRDEILLKPGLYTPEEYNIVKSHPEITKEILEKVYFTGDQKQIPFIASIHHEKLDGTGYPFGLKSDSIPILARIIAIVDVFDAIISYDRPYKPSKTIEEAIKILREESEHGRFDKEIVDIFIENKLYEIERRVSVRISPELLIEYRTIRPEEWHNIMPIIVRTKDVSGNILFFTTKEPLTVNSFLEVRIYLPEFTINVLAKVIKKQETAQGYEIGINFINLSPEIKKRIQKYLVDLTPIAT